MAPSSSSSLTLNYNANVNLTLHYNKISTHQVNHIVYKNPFNVSTSKQAINDEYDRKEAPSDDDPQCLSKTRTMRLRQDASSRTKTYPYISTVLQEEWMRYRDMHKKCTKSKNLTRALLFDNIKNMKMKNKSPQFVYANDDGCLEDDQIEGYNSCNYLTYLEGMEGLGNRLLSLASAWVYAMLTDTRRRMPELLCEPYGLDSSWVLPDDFLYSTIRPSIGSFHPMNLSQ